MRTMTVLFLGAGLVALCACGRRSPEPQAAQEPPELLEIAGRAMTEDVLNEPTTPVMSDSEIPDLVRKRLSRVIAEDFHVAPPGSTPATTDADRALIFAARSENHFTICYKILPRSTASGPRVIIADTWPGAHDYEHVLFVARLKVDCRSMSDLRKAFSKGDFWDYRPTFIDF